MRPPRSVDIGRVQAALMAAEMGVGARESLMRAALEIARLLEQLDAEDEVTQVPEVDVLLEDLERHDSEAPTPLPEVTPAPDLDPALPRMIARGRVRWV